MGAHLNLSYDHEGDILYVNAVEHYGEQQSDAIAAGVIARMNPPTGHVENLEILSFSNASPSSTTVFLSPSVSR